MIIDSTCGEVINSKDVYYHDDILESLSFNQENKELHLSILSAMEKYKGTIDFFGVIGFEMTSCDFWGSSSYICDFAYISSDESILTDKLIEKAKSPENAPYRLKEREKYIETVMTFISGDTLRVSCEKIVLQDV